VDHLADLLEIFFLRAAPLGVAFVAEEDAIASFGLPCTRMRSILTSTTGFLQRHIEASSISLYVSAFDHGRYLVAQFPFQESWPPPLRPWLAFVRLAVAIQLDLEPGELPGPPASSLVVSRPNPIPPKPRFAEASLEEEF
jgi:hypothetical protein